MPAERAEAAARECRVLLQAWLGHDRTTAAGRRNRDVTQEPGTDHRANLELYANAHLVLVHRARSHAEAAMRAADKAEADCEALRRSLPPALVVDGRGASGAAEDIQGAGEVDTCLKGESAADERRRAVALVRPLMMGCLLYTSPSPRDKRQSRMPSSA